MARVAFRLWIKPDKIAEYRESHKSVWPELLHDLKVAGVRNYSIFADGSELFGYFECDDVAAFNATMAESDANRRWQAYMRSYLATPIDPNADEPLRIMEEVFRLD